MQGDTLFKEKQGFDQGWFRFLLPALVSIAVIIGIIQFYTKEESLKEAIFTLIILSLLFALLFTVRMETEIKTDGIYVRFSPFHRQPTYYPWESISAAYIREYNPLSEYGGWGIRTGLFGHGSAYNMSGNIGIQLVLKNGQKHLIGTRQPQKAAEALRRLSKLTPVE